MHYFGATCSCSVSLAHRNSAPSCMYVMYYVCMYVICTLQQQSPVICLIYLLQTHYNVFVVSSVAPNQVLFLQAFEILQ